MAAFQVFTEDKDGSNVFASKETDDTPQAFEVVRYRQTALTGPESARSR